MISLLMYLHLPLSICNNFVGEVTSWFLTVKKYISLIYDQKEINSCNERSKIIS